MDSSSAERGGAEVQEPRAAPFRTISGEGLHQSHCLREGPVAPSC